MRRLIGFGISVLAIALSQAQVQAQGPAAPVSGVQAADLDPAVRPQDDFFDYANGTWLRETPIPADRSRWGVDSVMTARSLEQQRGLAQAARTSPDPEARKVGDFYASFMDEAGIERAGARPLQPELDRIAQVKRVRDLGPLLARLDRMGVSGPFSSYVYPDAKRSDRYALWFGEDGLGLPERDYYTSNDPKLAEPERIAMRRRRERPTPSWRWRASSPPCTGPRSTPAIRRRPTTP
jgi:putative endopeptidase